MLPTPPACDICLRGCSCPLTGPGCGHYGCWGRAPLTCPAAAAAEATHAAAAAVRRALAARTVSRRARHAAALRDSLTAARTLAGILSR
jgi:hypothetical protein